MLEDLLAGFTGSGVLGSVSFSVSTFSTKLVVVSSVVSSNRDVVLLNIGNIITSNVDVYTKKLEIFVPIHIMISVQNFFTRKIKRMTSTRYNITRRDLPYVGTECLSPFSQ